MAKILVLHGPNLNLLGTREPEVYGHATLADIDNNLTSLSKTLGHELDIHQSNAESVLIEIVQQACNDDGRYQFIIINPAALTHTSITLRDAIIACGLPFIEIHLSNIQARENFRHHSYLADLACGCIMGFGAFGYELALMAADDYLKHHQATN